MSKQDQILILEPKQELHFKGPFTDVVTSYLKLTNPSDRRVCFKVKTTAPKRYCVRPNNGIVEPHGNQTIAVMLQPFDVGSGGQSDGLSNEKSKHKFMVQTMFAPDGDVNQDSLWKEASPDAIMDSKLKCVFDFPPSATGETQGTGTTTSTNSASMVSGGSFSINNQHHDGHGSVKIRDDSSRQSGPATGASLSSQASPSTVAKTAEENKRLREEIDRLRHEVMQMKEEGLKHRIRGTGGDHSRSEYQSPSPAYLGSKSGESGDHLALILNNPILIAIGLVLFIAGLLLGKIVF